MIRFHTSNTNVDSLRHYFILDRMKRIYKWGCLLKDCAKVSVNIYIRWNSYIAERRDIFLKDFCNAVIRKFIRILDFLYEIWWIPLKVFCRKKKNKESSTTSSVLPISAWYSVTTAHVYPVYTLYFKWYTSFYN